MSLSVKLCAATCLAAVLGFMAAIAGEVSTGESLFAQTMSGGFLAAAAVIAFVVIASFAPAIRQARPPASPARPHNLLSPALHGQLPG